MCTQFVLIQFAYIDTINADVAFDSIIETWHKIGKGGLAGTAGADQGDGFASIDGHVDGLECGLFGVAERDIVEMDFTGYLAECFRAFGFGNRILGV